MKYLYGVLILAILAALGYLIWKFRDLFGKIFRDLTGGGAGGAIVGAPAAPGEPGAGKGPTAGAAAKAVMGAEGAELAVNATKEGIIEPLKEADPLWLLAFSPAAAAASLAVQGITGGPTRVTSYVELEEPAFRNSISAIYDRTLANGTRFSLSDAKAFRIMAMNAVASRELDPVRWHSEHDYGMETLLDTLISWWKLQFDAELTQIPLGLSDKPLGFIGPVWPEGVK